MADHTFTNEDHAAVASATKIVFSKFRNYVSYQDIQQECYLWLLANYWKADRWRSMYSEKHAERTVVKALRNAGERYARKEKAEQCGGTTDEEFFYSIPMIADLLALSFDPEWMIPKGIDYTDSKRSGKPAREGFDLPAMVADVTSAYEGLPEADRALLKRVYGDNDAPTEIARLALEWGCTQSAAYNRVRRVVGRVRAALGGPNPWREIPA